MGLSLMSLSSIDASGPCLPQGVFAGSPTIEEQIEKPSGVSPAGFFYALSRSTAYRFRSI